MRKKQNIDEIAELAQVSRSTVSRVLRNREDVSPRTRERVLEVIAETNFVPDSAAAALASGKTPSTTIGILIPDLAGFWASEILRGIGESAAEAYDLLLYTTSRSLTKQGSLSGALQQESIAGVIIILPTGGDEELQKIVDRNLPVVIVDHEGKQTSFPNVICENVRTSSLLTQHLLDLGHKRIAYVKGPSGYGLAHERYLGFISAMYNHGFKTSEDLIAEAELTIEGGYDAAAELLKKMPPITAIYAATDEMALGAIRAIRDAGKRVPEDVSVVGFGDVPGAAYSHPSLTTARNPLCEMGHVALRLLVDQIEKRQLAARSVILPGTIVIRESSGPLRLLDQCEHES